MTLSQTERFANGERYRQGTNPEEKERKNLSLGWGRCDSPGVCTKERKKEDLWRRGWDRKAMVFTRCRKTCFYIGRGKTKKDVGLTATKKRTTRGE